MILVLDSGAVSALSKRGQQQLARLRVLRERYDWPPVVVTPVLVECLTGSPARDANTNRFLKTCEVEPQVPETMARRAAILRTKANRGSAVDAFLVTRAEPGGTVLTGDVDDLTALAAHANGVLIKPI
ncbi:MAG: hypothetical protein FWG25_01310 [Promicromonosporaceae bacterium]|nr:hypothetical protein [Promicromonosporaceae bacterium]